MLFATLVLCVLALGPWVVSSFSFSLSVVDQCGPLTITFVGTPPADHFPLSLTIVPLDSTTTLSIPIPDIAVQSQGTWVSFLPLAAGMTFIASINNPFNTTEGVVTNVSTIQPSPTGNSSCLPTQPNPSPPHFTLEGHFTQCGSFNVTYDPTIISHPPSIRAFKPQGSSFLLNQTGQLAPGVASYLMNAEYGTNIVLLLDDFEGHCQTTLQILVGGDSGSDSTCLGSSLQESSPVQSQSSPVLTKGGIIAIAAASGSVILVMALLMMAYIIRERRKELAFLSHDLASKTNHKSPPTRPSRTTIPALFSAPNSPRVSLRATSQNGNDPETGSVATTRILSLEPRPATPSVRSKVSFELDRDGASGSRIPSAAGLSGGSLVDDASIMSLDIEDILNSATVFKDRITPEPSYNPQHLSRQRWFPPNPAPPSAPPPAQRNQTRSYRRTDFGDPSDVPADPLLSQSVNPSALQARSNRYSPNLSRPRPQGVSAIEADPRNLSYYNAAAAVNARSGLPSTRF